MTIFLYAVMTLGNTILTGILSGWLIYFYLPPNRYPLLPFALFGLVMLFSRICHIAANVAIHRFAPKTMLGWIWYTIAGAFLMPIVFPFLWFPPQPQATDANLLHLLLLLVAYGIASGLHQAGYEMLLPTLATDLQTRDAISNWRMGFLLLGSILVGFMGPLIQAFSYTQAIWIFTGLSAPMLIVPAIFLRIKLRNQIHHPQQSTFLESVKSAWAKPIFREFACSWGVMWLATTFIFETLPYIVTEIFHLSIKEMIYFCIMPTLLSIFMYPIVIKLANRYGSLTLYRFSLLTGAFVTLGLLAIGEHIPIPLFIQGLLWLALQTICLSGAQSLPVIIVAETATDDPNEQASLYAFGNLVDQLASGLALAIIPFFMLIGRGPTDYVSPLGIRFLGVASALFLLVATLIFKNRKVNKLN